ncbi:5-methyltetrahydropteroyltriglutamate--homocysteine S-methyltransferase [Clostridium isatidis]|uniref:5-methyltetrahydropteroyltriglutamate--homocysteine methyltransferase n=1 Tax=Clostridium isatidis TaxID=182773 RepID=A0A343JE78_9CLOT|nr:5-methyltetrahydropteroyltriglutamate--homocysteine S-methyltransferase [Clostridium isatidis]ASW43836.1 5-methyltetrahydropteroyltriglutamate--homocysteine methyltransferase [Clostridium isatidis]
MTKELLGKQRLQVPYRNDIVGSFLRPEELKKARKQYENGEISREVLRAIEDKAIRELVKKEKAAGLKSVTDGEFRRSWWHLDFMWGIHGVEYKKVERGYQFKGEETRAETAGILGKIKFTGEHPFLEHYKFLKELADEEGVEARQTIPAPAQLLLELQRPENIADVKFIYENQEDLINDIVKTYNQIIRAFYDLGCRNIQLDDCTWGTFCDRNLLKRLGYTEEQVKDTLNLFLKLNNLAIKDLPEDLIITTHVCRGNYHSTYASEGPYDLVAEILFANANVDAFYLEFDDERSGGFEPLKYVPRDKQVVLGLVSSKTGKLESKETIIRRIEEATKYLDLDQICLSPQCGFASTEEGNILTEEEQWNKIRLIKEITEEIWK